MNYVIECVSVATGLQMWVTGLNYSHKSEEVTGPIVSVSSDPDAAKQFSFAEAESLLPDVSDCYPEASIKPVGTQLDEREVK